MPAPPRRGSARRQSEGGLRIPSAAAAPPSLLGPLSPIHDLSRSDLDRVFSPFRGRISCLGQRGRWGLLVVSPQSHYGPRRPARCSRPHGIVSPRSHPSRLVSHTPSEMSLSYTAVFRLSPPLVARSHTCLAIRSGQSHPGLQTQPQPVRHRFESHHSRAIRPPDRHGRVRAVRDCPSNVATCHRLVL